MDGVEIANAGLRSAITSNLIAAVSVGALQMGTAVSLAALVFADELDSGLPRVAIAYVIGTGIVAAIVGSMTKMSVAISGAQDTAAIVAAAVAAGIAAKLDGAPAVSTAIVAIALAGLVSGILFVGIGRARLGEAARSIPFTVISGFMAGTGWLLFRGGLEVMTGRSIALGTLADFFTWDVVQYWLPGIALSTLIVAGLLRGVPSLVFGLLMLAAGVAIHVVGRIGWSLDALESNNWLIGPFPESQGWTPVLVSDFQQTDWAVIVSQVLPIAGLATVSLIGVVLNLTGLEVALEDDVDIDHEVQVAGAAAIASAVAGGMIGYHLIGSTVIADRIQARGRLVPTLIGAMCAATAVVGTSVVALMPRAVAGGVLAAAGINLLLGWVRQVRRDFARLDAVLSASVLIAIIAFGVLTGIAAGILAAVVVFVYSYGRVSPVRRMHRMSTMESNIDRTSEQRQVLLERDSEVAILELHGYLFFGSLRSITDLITPLLDEDLRYLVIDFRSVPGVDTSVVSGLLSIERKAVAAGVTLVWSHVGNEIERRLSAEGSDSRRFSPDIDHGLEWVENEVLASVEDLSEPAIDLEWVEAITTYGERLEVDAGETLIDISDDTRRVFAIVSGTLTAWGQSAGNEPIRYRQVGAGSFLGEVAFVTGAPRTANVVADVPCVVVALSPNGMIEMEQDDPSLAIQTTNIVATRLAERLGSTTQTVRNLSS